MGEEATLYIEETCDTQAVIASKSDQAKMFLHSKKKCSNTAYTNFVSGQYCNSF